MEKMLLNSYIQKLHKQRRRAEVRREKRKGRINKRENPRETEICAISSKKDRQKRKYHQLFYFLP
jgi:hypothetical protein